MKKFRRAVAKKEVIMGKREVLSLEGKKLVELRKIWKELFGGKGTRKSLWM
ncbi:MULTISPECIES: hypothetical protein [unclassified Wolbachia]|uniref:hypothetical protein n=1 Tax=unclassified Wolbachia TaxID=2640676 RepID=UPI003132A329